MDRRACVVGLVIAACGSRTERAPSAGSGSGAVAPGDAALAASVGADVPATLRGCTDGGKLIGAAASDTAVRFCVDEYKQGISCWTFPIEATATAKALPPPGALDNLTRLQAPDKKDRTPAGRWTATIKDDKLVEACGADGCKTFAVIPGKTDDDAPSGSDAAAVSASGTYVAVKRGFEGVSKKQTIEIYERASGKRIAEVKPGTRCVFLEGFANDAVVAVEWDCANHGGDRLIISKSGAITRIKRLTSPGDPFVQLDGDHWMFSETGTASLEIYDVATGKHLGGRELEQFALIAALGGRAFAIEPQKARMFVFDKDGKQIASGRVPPCRYEWEEESVGPLKLLMHDAELVKALGAPAKKSKGEPMTGFRSIWTFSSGVVAQVTPNYVNDATDKPVPPWFVEGFAITAPSKLQIKGVGIGSTLEDLRKAFAGHEVASATSATRFVAGNDDQDGIQFTLADGKVKRIAMGELQED